MSKGLDIELQGVDALLKRMQDRSDNMAKIIDKTMSDNIANINEQQKKNCAAVAYDTGTLVAGNEMWRDGQMKFVLRNDIEYAPYVEFGTGGMVRVPPGLEEIAIQFKGLGIKEVNLPARPFFFRAFFENKDKMIQNIKNAVLK